MPNSDLLAVAFTDVNGNGKYNAGKDTLIAAIVDTNNDHTVSIGDTIQWGTYPAIPDGSASGTGGIYTSLQGTITNVVFTNSEGALVETAAGRVEFLANTNVEAFHTSSPGGNVESSLIDSITLPDVGDSILADPNQFGAGQPNFPVDVSNTTTQLGDNAFLDVFIAAGWHVV